VIGCGAQVAVPIPLSTVLERVEWLGATVFWGNTETEVGVVRGSSGKGSTSPVWCWIFYLLPVTKTKHIYEHSFIHCRFSFTGNIIHKIN